MNVKLCEFVFDARGRVKFVRGSYKLFPSPLKSLTTTFKFFTPNIIAIFKKNYANGVAVHGSALRNVAIVVRVLLWLLLFWQSNCHLVSSCKM